MSNYPVALDNDNNLYLVHDLLRVKLANDYNPGNTSITISGNNSLFPSSGLITLTEQGTEDVTLRALSFSYASKTSTTFDGLTLLPNFTDNIKLKNVTDVTMNVMAQHHNSIKDSLIAVETFIGVKGTTDTAPGGATMEGRTNYLRDIVLAPRAWFTSDKRVGIAPFEVCFTDQSFRNPTSWSWDFGEGSISNISISAIPSTIISVPSGTSSIQTITVDDEICKTYYSPGKYDVTLTVSNIYGTDTITIPEYITVRTSAPDQATIDITPTKTTTDNLIELNVSSSGEQPDDPIITYTWNLGDDLTHLNSPNTIASYSIGGLYDVKLRTDTTLGAYRITTLQNAINIVEQTNLWWLAFDSPKSTLSTIKNLYAYEFGLISETFKTASTPALSVSRDYSFLSSYTNQSYQQNIFLKNAGITPTSTTSSGNLGNALLYWASNATTINFELLQPFNSVWSGAGISSLTRNWGWVSVNTPTDINFVLGNGSISDSVSATNQQKDRVSLGNYSITSTNFTSSNYQNGADELTTNPDSYPATYRTTFSGGTAYLARNEAGPGAFFRINSFYSISGVLNSYVQNFLKLQDIPGSAKTELQLATLTSGIYVFNNSGEVAMYNPTTSTWSTTGPGVGSTSFKSLQDTSVIGYADTSQPLLVATDGDHRAYLSYDYSPNAFIKFNDIDLTFTSLGTRPNGNEQFAMTVF